MPWFTTKKPKVHIVIKDHVFRFIEATQPNILAVRVIGERYLPPGVIRDGKVMERETLTMILSEVVDEYKLKGRQVHFFVPDAYVVIRKLMIPADIPDDEIIGYLYLELGESIHLPFDDAQFDFSILEKGEEQTEIILVASPRAMIDEYSAVLDDLKLKPVVADVSSLSMYRLLKSLDFIQHDEHLMLLQVDIRAVNVTIFHEGIPQFTRHLKMNLDHELWEVKKGKDGMERLVWSEEPDEVEGQLHDVITEIDRMLNFYRFSVNQGKVGVTRLLVTGDYPDIDDIVNRLNAAVDVPVDQLSELYAGPRSSIPISTRFQELLGLALKSEVQ